MNTHSASIPSHPKTNHLYKMVKKFSICMVVLSLTVMATSNAQQAPEHDKRIYRAEDGKLYINKDLPVYVRIASSPEEDAKSWRLKSEQTEDYANPMYLDAEGWNSLRSPSAVDTASKEVVYPLQDIIFDMYADGLAPKTNLEYGTSEFFENDGIIFFGNDIDLEFDASDQMSGLEDVYYSINGKDYQPAGKYPLDITEEGEYQLQFYAVDNVGNAEESQTIKFTIDHTPPVTEHQVDGLKDDKVLTPDATISLSGDDNLSGVADVYYAVDDNEFRKYENPIPVSVLQNTRGRITYYAIDNTGNKEEPNHIGTMASSDKKTDGEKGETFDYYIDREPPKPELTFEEDYYEGDRDYISERTQIVLEATDDKSGVQKILYSYNGFITQEEYEGPFNPEGNSPVELLYTAIDNTDNRAEEKSREFYIDRAAPESELSFDGPVFKNRDTTFISGGTKIALDAKDAESGVKNIQFRLNDQEEKTFNQAFAPEKKGKNLIEWTATDNVNNTAETRKKIFVVDNEAPGIHYHFSVEPIGEKVVRDEKYVIYPSNTKLYIGATDDVTGEESLQYTINDSKTAKTIPVSGFEPGNYEIAIEAKDALQNKTQKTIRFAIEN